MGSGLINLHMKDVLVGKSFTISKNWLALGGAGTLGSARLQNVKASDC